jgi:cytochrome c553
MRRLLRWAGYALATLSGLVLLAAILVYGITERRFGREYDAPLPAITVLTDSATVARGEHLASTLGCRGCHGPDLGGEELFSFLVPVGGRVVAPNLTRQRARYTDAELARVIRIGVRSDGSSTLAMPTQMLHHLSDEDVAAIIAYVRTRPEVGTDLPRTVMGPLMRALILREGVQPGPERVARDAPRAADRLDGSPERLGEYIAYTSCSECHGADLHGSDDGSRPDLAIAGAYSLEQFARLMRDGIALGERELGMMSDVARGRFSHFTDEEVAALHEYLRTRAAQPSS